MRVISSPSWRQSALQGSYCIRLVVLKAINSSEVLKKLSVFVPSSPTTFIHFYVFLVKRERNKHKATNGTRKQSFTVIHVYSQIAMYLTINDTENKYHQFYNYSCLFSVSFHWAIEHFTTGAHHFTILKHPKHCFVAVVLTFYAPVSLMKLL